jgi:hypothetical protein
MDKKSTEKRTLLGYHDKHVNKMGIIDPKSLPIFIEERYAPFLVTRDYIFNVSTNKIVSVIENFKAFRKFNFLKKIIANILVLPGIAIAILYTLQLLNLLGEFNQLNPILTNNVINFSFWLSVLAIIILWHDYYRTKSHPPKLPNTESISVKEIEDIKISGFKFGRYSPLESLYFFSEESLLLLVKNLRGERFDSYRILYDSLFDPLSREMFNRADLDISISNLKDLGIFDNTLPEYNVSGLRNIVIYATEAAIKTNSQQIEIVHFVIALFKVYPVLQKILQENKISVEMLEESVKYLLAEIYKKEHRGFFDLTRPYYKNGGIAKNWIYGWTFILGHFSSDVNEKVSSSQETFGIGHKHEVEALISAVGKLTNNKVLLTGEPGTGKSSIIKGLAQRINREMFLNN